MAKFKSLVPGSEIENAAEDFRAALKVEQYRIGKAAVYIPAGFKWEYIPRSAITSAEDSHHSITAGHCVTVTEVKPAVDLSTEAGSFTLSLEKSDSIRKILEELKS